MVWKKGQSGNPAGLPKGASAWVPLGTTLKKLIDGMAKERDADGKLLFPNMTYRQLMCLALVRQVIKGNQAAIKEVFQRVDGKVPQPIVGANGNEPVKINIVLDAGDD